MENQENTENTSTQSGRGKQTKVPEERYFRVIFSDKASPSDTDDVELSVNGETLLIRRGIEVIIPERYRICADNATYPHFQQVPGKPRKLRGHIKVYPYQLIGGATKAQYNKMKKDGDRKQADFIKKYGFDASPDEV